MRSFLHSTAFSVAVLLATLLSPIVSGGCSDGNSPTGAAGRAAIAGVVVSGLGRPVAGATVSTIPASRSVVTDPDGRFAIGGLEVALYTVVATRATASTRAMIVAMDDTARIDLRLSLWQLAWSDEFEGDRVDSERWRQPVGDLGAPDGLTRIRLSASSVSEGRLRLTHQPDSLESGRYSSGMLVSRGFFQYGRFEIRARFPAGRGLWGSLWLWPLDKHSAPELDIVEILGHDPTVTYATYHFADGGGVRRSKLRAWRGKDRTKEFCTYALEWYPDEVRWFIDSAEVFRTTLVQKDEPMNLIILTLVGGAWPGSPDSTTVFPCFTDVEYVRIYSSVD